MKKSKLPIDLRLPTKLILKSLLIWFLCLIVFFTALYFDTNQFTSTIQETEIRKSVILGFILFSSFLIGIVASFTAIHTLTKHLIRLVNNNPKIPRVIKRSPFLIKYLTFILVLPILLLIYAVITFKTHKSILRVLTLTVALTGILPVWLGGYFVIGTLAAGQLGYITQPIPIAGTGSMYPTFPKGKTKTPKEQGKEIVGTPGMFPYPNGLVLFGNRVLGHQIGRGDIVTWENDATRELTSRDGSEPVGLLKRVIAVSGDTLELKEGVVYLNSQPLKEPYIAKPRSTFGEKFLKECQRVEVPKSYVFAMGDNRKGSADSREIGFVPISDIDYVIPLNSQKGALDKNWHDTTTDLEGSSKIKIDRTKFLELLNEKRRENGANPLKYQAKLEKSATYRGQAILKYDDFSFEASRSGYPMEKAISDAGYWNNYNWEVFIPGYYEAEELIEDYLERDTTETKKYWFDKRFQDIGIAEVEGTLNNCPTQVVVIHIGGYVPPNYTKDVIESWRQAVNNLNGVIPSWERVKGQSWINQDDLKRLLDLLNRERAIASSILSKMEANQWLTRDEENSTKEYDRLSTESIELAKKLNSR